jgi:muramoyltetrapeptide carboxypeptidase
MQWQSIHGPMPIDLAGEQNDDSKQSWDYLRHMLFGQIPAYTLPVHALNRCGNATAPLVGGNLSVIYSLNATPYQWSADGCILFIEDVNENLHHLDRMMNNLHIGGQLSQLKGLLVGAMTGMRDSDPSFGKTAYEIIAGHVEEYDYPVVFGFPAGHAGVNYPLILGANASLHVTGQTVAVEQT